MMSMDICRNMTSLSRPLFCSLGLDKPTHLYILLLKIESLCIILYIKCSTRESLYIGRGKSNAQVKGVLYKTMYWA